MKSRLESKRILALIGLALLCGGPALAQDFGGPSPLATGQRRPGRDTPPPADHPRLAPLAAQAEPWPRLDPGAVLCRSANDLARLNAVRQARAAGVPAPAEGPIDCSVIQSRTPITIVSRDGPSRTEVKLTRGSDEVGWTDVYLPARAPGRVATP